MWKGRECRSNEISEDCEFLDEQTPENHSGKNIFICWWKLKSKIDEPPSNPPNSPWNTFMLSPVRAFLSSQV